MNVHLVFSARMRSKIRILPILVIFVVRLHKGSNGDLS